MSAEETAADAGEMPQSRGDGLVLQLMMVKEPQPVEPVRVDRWIIIHRD